VDVLCLGKAGSFDRILRRLSMKVRCAVEVYIIDIELSIKRSIQNIIKSPRLDVVMIEGR
jgi:hypothetical protein